ncbi:beta-lactamase-like protein [Neofusicoccum parvum]|nr:beta-lactamase-like protein [Neofusicoccum parvum]
MASQLRADLYNAPAIPTSDFLPDSSIGFWQPTVVTLISGRSEAVLVDTLFTSDQGVALGDWIEDTLGAKKLVTIYITHGHGDHWFNVPSLTKRFPGAEVVATKESIEHMSTQLSREFRKFWYDLFPGQINEGSFQIMAKPLKDSKFTMEGYAFKAVNVGHSDTDATSFLRVPSLNMSVAGDIVYNDVHMRMTESSSQNKRDGWIRSLEQLEAYNPAIVIGSHHRPGGVDGAFNIGASKEYVQNFSKLVQESASAKELYDRVLGAYPNRIGKLVLWTGCKAAFPSAHGI